VLLALRVRKLKVDVRLSHRLHVNAHASARRKVTQVTTFAPVPEAFNGHAYLSECFSTVIPDKDGYASLLAHQHTNYIKQKYSNDDQNGTSRARAEEGCHEWVMSSCLSLAIVFFTSIPASNARSPKRMPNGKNDRTKHTNHQGDSEHARHGACTVKRNQSFIRGSGTERACQDKGLG